MKHFFLILIFSQVFLVSCSSVRESAGVNRKSIDEYQVIENPPLVIPPDFKLLPPEQLASKNIEDMVNKTKELLSDKEKLDKLRSAGYKRAKYFKWSKTAKNTIEVLQS